MSSKGTSEINTYDTEDTDHIEYLEDEEESFYSGSYYDTEEDDDTEWDNPYDEGLDISVTLVSNGYYGDLLVYEKLEQENGLVVLASQSVLIADIDCGENTQPYLDILKAFTQKTASTFEVYKTRNGMRYIQLDRIYSGVNKEATRVLSSLNSDENYLNFCQKKGRFMARLTPKLDLEAIKKYREDVAWNRRPSVRVCNYLMTIGEASSNLIASEMTRFHAIETGAWMKAVPLA